MDGCSSWLLLHGHGHGTESDERSYGSSACGLHEELDEAIGLQIYMLLDTEEHGYDDAGLPTRSSSSTFPSSFSGGSPDENSSLMLAGSTSCHHYQAADVSYDDDFGTIPTLDLENLVTEEAHHKQEQAAPRNNGGHESRGAFRPYVRDLSPRKKPKPGACGQRAFKATMSALARMHMARLAQLRSYSSYQVEMAAPPSNNSNQLQHVLSERKRREKLNDSFKALRTVLPPGTKKDKASTLIRARDYVNALKSRVSELEEKHRMLVESQHHGGGQEEYSREQTEVDVIRPAAEDTTPQEFLPEDGCRSRVGCPGCCCFHTSAGQRGWRCKMGGHGNRQQHRPSQVRASDSNSKQ